MVMEMEKNGGLNRFLREHEFYLDEKIVSVLEVVLVNGRKGILLRGPAGVGKTQLTWLVARYLGAEYIFYQCSFGTSEDDLLYKYIPSETTKSGIRITLGPIPRALVASKSRKTVLVLDEFDKTRPSADALLLDLLQNSRVSLYLDESETIIQGNTENLVVFLTSNDMREFSEPLLRRVITISLPLLDTRTVYSLLSKRFSEEISVLLTQIYDDTVKASLRKPATIQELQQLGEILEQGVSVSLDQLLQMFVVKYDDDWAKFKQYITSRNAYSFTNNTSDTSESIEQYYEPSGSIAVHTEQKQQESVTSVNSLLERIKSSVRKFDMQAVPEKVTDSAEVCLKMVDEDFDAYTSVIQKLKPQPTDDPSVFGKFKYVQDEINAIIANEPLSIREAFKLWKDQVIEMYYEDIIFTDSIESIISHARKIKYYTESKVYLIFYYPRYENELEERVVLEKLGDNAYYVRGYLKKSNRHFEPALLPELANYTFDHDKLLKMLRNKEYSKVYIPATLEMNIDYDYKEAEIRNLIVNITRSNLQYDVTVNPKVNYNLRLNISNGKASVVIGYRVAKELFSGKQSYTVDEIIKTLERRLQ